MVIGMQGYGGRKISIIVPVYNGAAYIKRCMDGLLAQTYPNMEILLIDDGSTDGSGRICDDFADKYSQVKAYHVKNAGVSAARNKGIGECSGEYVGFVDVDDYLLEDMTEHLARMLEETGSDVAGCGFFEFGGKMEEGAEAARADAVGRCTGKKADVPQTEGLEILSGKEFIEKGILRSDTRCWSKLYRKSAIGELRFAEGLTIGEDMLFLLELARMGKQFCRSSYQGYGYYTNEEGAMRKGFKDSYMDQIVCWQKALAYMEKELPQLADRSASILLISVMLVVGKLAILSGKERKAKKEYGDKCYRLVKEYRRYGKAYQGLDAGYRLKVTLYLYAPGVYMWLYHWKGKKLQIRSVTRKDIIMPKDKIILYMHAGSGNHGCEAIVNSLCHMLNEKPLVLTNSAEEDRKYSLVPASGEALCELAQEQHFSRHKAAHVLYYLWRKITKDAESFIRYRYQAVFRHPLEGKVAVSIGGDNYCYDMMIKDLMLANRAFHDKGARTILLGCSIEPELLTAKTAESLIEDMNRYDLIVARESITYEALKKVVPEEKLRLIPDPAFTLRSKKLPLPEGFAEGNTVGVNVSPMIQDNEAEAGITMSNYKALIEHIIRTTDMQIALIPHVIWARNDDRRPIGELYEAFKDTGRVVRVEDASCEELKGFIGRCRMFIGARTHATIAAYSSLVPTLTVGYSVKAKGIAKDLFGTYENYVLPVQQLQEKEDLIGAFEWLRDYEQDIRKDLSNVMPAYKERALSIGREIESL